MMSDRVFFNDVIGHEDVIYRAICREAGDVEFYRPEQWVRFDWTPRAPDALMGVGPLSPVE